jgi:hypothetical protein
MTDPTSGGGDSPADVPKLTKVERLRERHAAAQKKFDEAIQKHAEATTPKQLATTEARAEKARVRVQELNEQLETAERLEEHRVAEVSVQAALDSLREVTIRGFSDPKLKPVFERYLVARLDELRSLRETASRLSGRVKELTDDVRSFVMSNPTGYTPHDDPEKRYLCWISLDGAHQVVLQDNPRYALTVDRLSAKIGMASAVRFLKVDYTALEKSVSAGQVVDAEGSAVTLEDLRQWRDRSEQQKKVMVLDPDKRFAAEVIGIVDPALATEYIERLDTLGLDGNTINALRAANVKYIGQLRCMSGDDLARVKGIGPKRAAAIIEAIVRRRK